jgi:hypothetical protein
MHTNEPREIQGVELGYDPRDVEPKGLTKVVVMFLGATVFFFGVGAWLWMALGYSKPSTFNARKPRFEGPRVQGNITSKTDIMAMRQEERRLMTTYEPLKGGKWRIPVDQAITLLGDRGLPAITSAAPAKSTGTTIQQNAVGPATAGSTEPTTPPTETSPHSSSEGTAPEHTQP